MPGLVRFLAVWGLLGTPVAANAPERSVQPEIRPQLAEQVRPEQPMLVMSQSGVRVSLRPVLRPNNFRPQNIPQTISSTSNGPVPQGRMRSICGKPSIRGQRLAAIPGRLNGCGLAEPVRVFSVSGVSLSQGSIMDCTTAEVLDQWVGNSVKPTIGRVGGGVASLQVASHYACRTRNSRAGAKISEHGKGHAIDISGFNLHDGATISVLKGWRDQVQGKILRKLHQAACGPFGTVLGPNSDRYHRDHFHLDTARYRSGSYCR